MTNCSSCGSTHLGPDCGMTFRERLGTTSLSGTVTATRTKHYGSKPSEAVASVFGEDARERMLEETDGIGAVKSSGGQDWYRNRRTGEVERADQKVLSRATGGFFDD